MRASNAARAAPALAGGDPQVEQLPGSFSSQINQPRALSQVIPSKAALARRFPTLRVNRFTGRWRDDASSARGDDVASLLAFIGGEALDAIAAEGAPR